GQQHLGSASALLVPLAAGLVELRRVVVHRLRRRRVGRVCDRGRGRLDLRLDRRLLTALGRSCRLVRGRELAAILAARRLAAVAAAQAARLARGRQARAARTAASPPRLVLLAETGVLGCRQALVALRHDLALVDPDLDADAAEGGLRLDEAEVDVRADRVQRD